MAGAGAPRPTRLLGAWAVALLLLATLVAVGCEKKSDESAEGEKQASAESAEGAAESEGGEEGADEEAAGGEGSDEAGESGGDEGESAAEGETDGDEESLAASSDGNVDWEAVLQDPSKATHKAPSKFKVELDTTKGPVILEIEREKSPLGADRLYNLVKSGYMSDLAIFRVVPGFVIQFGMHGDPEINAKWAEANIKDEPVKGTNARGTITFAKTRAPNTRSTQFFINLGNNARLDQMGFSPLGKVVEGMQVVDAINDEYGEKPDQAKIHQHGNEYLKANFPKLDYIKSAKIVE